uniref:Uncharacterized protein n=1 Tax=Panagrolaimus sp. ES5 TaxID=591445 RepID=A0AC34F6H7_9BILA
MVAAAVASPTPSQRIDASFDSDDFSSSNSGGQQRDREVDLSQLFSDVSRTVGNLKNILSSNRDSLGGGPGGAADSDTINQSTGTSSRLDSASSILNDIMGNRDDQQSPIAKLFGSGSGVCFKTCGFEDIQAAARRAGELFFTMKVCLIILTLVAVLCFLAITVAVLFYIYKNRHTLRQLTSSSSNSVNDDGHISVTPLIFSKRTQPLLSNSANNNPPKPPAHQSTTITTHSANNQQKHSPVSNSSSSD